MFKNGLFIILLFVTIIVIGQNDSIIKNNAFDSTKGFQINAQLIEKGIEIDETIDNIDISYLFYSKKEKLPFNYKFDPTKYLDPIEKKRNFMFGPKPIADDVVVVKYFGGVDKTIKEFRTAQNIGTIESNTEFLRIEYKDFALIDGDRIRFYLNKKAVEVNTRLEGLYFTVYIKLDKVGYNRIDIEALNQGYAGENTAEYIIYDDKGNVLVHDAWYLKKGEMATLGIVKL